MARQKLLTTLQAAHKYGFSAAYVARLAQSGKIDAKKMGRDWLINDASMEAYSSSWQQRKPGPKKSQQEESQI